MSVLETRGAMNLGDKIWGILPDRVIVGRHVADRSFTPLALTDPRKDFLFCDFKMEEDYFAFEYHEENSEEWKEIIVRGTKEELLEMTTSLKDEEGNDIIDETTGKVKTILSPFYYEED